jgi:regulatory protein
MLITSLQQGKRDRLRANVYIDGEFWAALEQTTIANYRLYQGLELKQADISQILFDDAVIYISRKLFDWSQRRPRSQREIRNKLTEKFNKMTMKNYTASENVLDMQKLMDAVLEKLNKYSGGDEHFARWFAAERVKQGKYGSRKIISELIAKGIEPKVAQKIVKESAPDETDLQVKLLLKKFGVERLKDITDLKTRSRAYRYLMSKGFTDLN